MSKTTIEQTLTQSNATAEFYRKLNAHFGVGVWSNQYDKVTYQKADHHTLSLYLDGGYSTRRLDRRSAGTGAPDKLTILPAGHQSEWEIGGRQRFVHLYFSDSILRDIALKDFDMDPRLVELPDATYFDDQYLREHYRHLTVHNWDSPEHLLALQEQMTVIIADLLMRYNVKPASPSAYQGGLTRHTLNRVMDYIYANLDQTIQLDELAETAGISTFHFARMFKVSTGQSPHQKVLETRIAHARSLLEQGQSQLDTSLACGFASQSHLSRAFKHYVGITPGQYGKLYR